MIVDPRGNPYPATDHALADPLDGYIPRRADADGKTPELRAALAADLAAQREMARYDAGFAAAVDLDGYSNELTGIGNYLYDKTRGGANGIGMDVHRFTGVEAETRYRGSDLGARVVGVIPDEMTREGWTLQVQPTEEEAVTASDPIAQRDAALRSPRRAAVAWRMLAARGDSAFRARALAHARRWDALAADPAAQAQAQAGQPPPAPPPPGPLPKLNDEGIELAEAMEKLAPAART